MGLRHPSAEANQGRLFVSHDQSKATYFQRHVLHTEINSTVAKSSNDTTSRWRDQKTGTLIAIIRIIPYVYSEPRLIENVIGHTKSQLNKVCI